MSFHGEYCCLERHWSWLIFTGGIRKVSVRVTMADHGTFLNVRRVPNERPSSSEAQNGGSGKGRGGSNTANAKPLAALRVPKSSGSSGRKSPAGFLASPGGDGGSPPNKPKPVG